MRKLLKVVGVFILSVIIISLIAALFVRKEYSLEVSEEIHRSKDDVFNYVLLLQNQEEYSVWALDDPATEISHKGTDGTVGFIYSWESDDKKVGQGEQEITHIEPGSRIEHEIRFIKPFKAVSHACFQIDKNESEEKTNLNWGISGKMKYPINLIFLFVDFEKNIKDDLETGLKQLKEILESNH